MPSANHSSDEYSSCLEVVEQLISQLTADGPLIVGGDLNAHLGGIEDGRETNHRGSMWNSLIYDYNLYNATVGCLSAGPSYTYASGGHFTMVDYLIMNQDGSRGVSSCSVTEEHPLNTSDHLPVSCSLDISHLRSEPATTFPTSSLDWAKAGRSREVMLLYSKATDDIVRPLMEKDYSCIDDLDQDVQHVCRAVVEAGDRLIPKKSSSKVRDRTLSHLCWKSRVAFRHRKEANRPRSGPLFLMKGKSARKMFNYI